MNCLGAAESVHLHCSLGTSKGIKLPTVRLPLLHGHPCPSDLVSIEVRTPAESCARITLHPLEVAFHSAPWHCGAQEFPFPGLFLGEVTRGLGLEAAAPLLFTEM